MEDNKTPQQTLQKEEPSHLPDTRPPASPTPSHILPMHLPKWAAILILIIIATIFLFGFLSVFKSEKKDSQSSTPKIKPTIAPISTSNWKTYTNEEFSFSIDIPPDVEITEKTTKPNNIENPTCLVIFKRTIGRPLQEGLFEIPICYYDNPKKLSLAEFDTSHSRPTDVDGITTPKLSSPENIELILSSGTRAYYQKEHYCVARCPRYIIVHENKIFTLTARGLRGNDEKIFNQILSTFKFTNDDKEMTWITSSEKQDSYPFLSFTIDHPNTLELIPSGILSYTLAPSTLNAQEKLKGDLQINVGVNNNNSDDFDTIVDRNKKELVNIITTNIPNGVILNGKVKSAHNDTDNKYEHIVIIQIGEIINIISHEVKTVSSEDFIRIAKSFKITSKPVYIDKEYYSKQPH